METIKLIRNEQTKLSATHWNNVGVALLTGGLLLPLFVVARVSAIFDGPIRAMISRPIIVTSASALSLSAAARQYADYLLVQLRS
jgi:hypothetical protein